MHLKKKKVSGGGRGGRRTLIINKNNCLFGWVSVLCSFVNRFSAFTVLLFDRLHSTGLGNVASFMTSSSLSLSFFLSLLFSWNWWLVNCWELLNWLGPHVITSSFRDGNVWLEWKWKSIQASRQFERSEKMFALKIRSKFKLITAESKGPSVKMTIFPTHLARNWLKLVEIIFIFKLVSTFELKETESIEPHMKNPNFSPIWFENEKRGRQENWWVTSRV